MKFSIALAGSFSSLACQTSGLFRSSVFYEYINILVSCSREFTHRVKSVSMAKFTSQEVEALQNGGNQVQGLISSSLVKGVSFSVLMRLSLFSACKRIIFEGLGPSKAAIA